jgi:hypothetical protein
VGQLLALDHVVSTVDSKGRIRLGKITRADNDHGLEQHASLLSQGHPAEEILNPLFNVQDRIPF